MKKCLITAVLSGLILSAFSGCYFFPEEEALLDPPTIKKEEVTYSTYTARAKTITSQLIVTGYVYSKTQAECYFTDYTGQIKTIYPKVGDRIEAGDLVAEMNTGVLEFELETQRLKVQLAQLNYNASGSASDKLQLEIEQNILDQYQAEYDGAKIYAPISGQVSFVEKVSPGDEVNPYKVLVRIVDPDELYVKATLSDVNALRVSDAVTVTIGEDSFSGAVSRTPAEARAEGDEDVTSVSVDFTGTQPTFAYLGKLADIVYVRAVSENAVVIPKNLVLTLDGRTYVQVLADGVKQEADVVTGISNATEIEIISGLEPGDEVVVK